MIASYVLKGPNCNFIHQMFKLNDRIRGSVIGSFEASISRKGSEKKETFMKIIILYLHLISFLKY